MRNGSRSSTRPFILHQMGITIAASAAACGPTYLSCPLASPIPSNLLYYLPTTHLLVHFSSHLFYLSSTSLASLHQNTHFLSTLALPSLDRSEQASPVMLFHSFLELSSCFLCAVIWWYINQHCRYMCTEEVEESCGKTCHSRTSSIAMIKSCIHSWASLLIPG